MVPVAQWLERLTVDQEVVGSRPIRHPTPTSKMLTCHWQVIFFRGGFALLTPPAALFSCSRDVTLLPGPPGTPAEVTPAMREGSLVMQAAISAAMSRAWTCARPAPAIPTAGCTWSVMDRSTRQGPMWGLGQISRSSLGPPMGWPWRSLMPGRSPALRASRKMPSQVGAIGSRRALWACSSSRRGDAPEVVVGPDARDVAVSRLT